MSSKHVCAALAQAYIRPKASGKEMLLVSRLVVFCFGMFTGVICIILNVVRIIPMMLAWSLNLHCMYGGASGA